MRRGGFLSLRLLLHTRGGKSRFDFGRLCLQRIGIRRLGIGFKHGVGSLIRRFFSSSPAFATCFCQPGSLQAQKPSIFDTDERGASFAASGFCSFHRARRQFQRLVFFFFVKIGWSAVAITDCWYLRRRGLTDFCTPDSFCCLPSSSCSNAVLSLQRRQLQWLDFALHSGNHFLTWRDGYKGARVKEHGRYNNQKHAQKGYGPSPKIGNPCRKKKKDTRS